MLIDSLVGFFHHKESHNGKSLDVAYITPQLIASAMPTDEFVQSYYRMSASLLVDFLTTRHGDNWHIWSLQEDSELGYVPANIGGSGKPDAVTRYPVPDHLPVPVHTLVQIATELRQYIEASPGNVALVHCKCGKGRTGTVVIAYLMLFHGIPLQNAANEFTQKRIRLGMFEGITIRSQRRYLQYVDRWLKANRDASLLATPGIRIVQLVLRNPTVDDFDLDLGPVSRDEPGYVQKRAWDITFKDKYYLLRPLDSGALPVDLVLRFMGYKRKGGYRIATSSVSYAFNVLFEPNDVIGLPLAHDPAHDPAHDTGSGGCSPAISSRNYAPSSVFSAIDDLASLQSCICQWSETDGIGGLALRGIKAFDSVEVFWRKLDPADAPASIIASNYEAPQDIDNLP